MSAFRSCLLLCLISLPLSFGLFLIGRTLGYGEFRGGYAVLSFDASVDDSLLRGLLSDTGGFAGAPVSESSQWVMLDNFFSLETVPLDKYLTRVTTFDPRNDGYAAALREVFVRDGKRFVYVPLEQGNWTPLLLDKKFKTLLADIPFSGEYYGTGMPLKLFYAAYAAASLCLLIICYVKKFTPHNIIKIAMLIPVFFCLAFFGAAGIAFAAMLFAFFIFFKEPFNELSASVRSSFGGNSGKLKLIYKEIIKPYSMHWLFLPVFAAAFGIAVVFSKLKLLFLLAVFAAACAVFFFSSKVLSLSGGGHRRFNPVLIISRPCVDFTFCLCMLPFTAAAFFAVFFSPYISGAYASEGKFETIIEERDYYAHLAFQSGFSTRRLGAAFDSGYPSYIFDENGLPYPDGNYSGEQAFNMNDFPAFPLRHLMDFFQNVNEGGKAGGKGKRDLNEIPVLAVLLLFLIPLFIKRKDAYPAKNNIEGIKRFSVKPRIKNAMNKTNVYGGKYRPRILKDA
jgi:hypothetical protein